MKNCSKSNIVEPGALNDNHYRPEFLDHFDKKNKAPEVQPEGSSKTPTNEEEIYANISASSGQPSQNPLKSTADGQSQSDPAFNLQTQDLKKELKFMSTSELMDKMSNIDKVMELDIDDLRRRYHAKLQPIRDAIDQKRKQQQNF